MARSTNSGSRPSETELNGTETFPNPYVELDINAADNGPEGVPVDNDLEPIPVVTGREGVQIDGLEAIPVPDGLETVQIYDGPEVIPVYDIPEVIPVYDIPEVVRDDDGPEAINPQIAPVGDPEPVPDDGPELITEAAHGGDSETLSGDTPSVGHRRLRLFRWFVPETKNYGVGFWSRRKYLVAFILVIAVVAVGLGVASTRWHRKSEPAP